MSCNESGYQISHFFFGFIGALGGQLKTLVNSIELERVPITLYLGGQ